MSLPCPCPVSLTPWASSPDLSYILLFKVHLSGSTPSISIPSPPPIPLHPAFTLQSSALRPGKVVHLNHSSGSLGVLNPADGALMETKRCCPNPLVELRCLSCSMLAPLCGRPADGVAAGAQKPKGLCASRGFCLYSRTREKWDSIKFKRRWPARIVPKVKLS